MCDLFGSGTATRMEMAIKDFGGEVLVVPSHYWSETISTSLMSEYA
jgi:hypothetical protein